MRSAAALYSCLFGLLLLGAGCQSRPDESSYTAVARFLIEAESTKGALEVVLPMSGVSVRVAAKPVISEFDIRRVVEAEVEMGKSRSLSINSFEYQPSTRGRH